MEAYSWFRNNSSGKSAQRFCNFCPLCPAVFILCHKVSVSHRRFLFHFIMSHISKALCMEWLRLVTKVLDACVRAASHLVMRLSLGSTIPDCAFFLSFLFSYYSACFKSSSGKALREPLGSPCLDVFGCQLGMGLKQNDVTLKVLSTEQLVGLEPSRGHFWPKSFMISLLSFSLMTLTIRAVTENHRTDWVGRDP